jgi:hypothetical protein
MSIRTTVTLDDDVLDKVKRESMARGRSFRDTLNDLLRFAVLTQEAKPRVPFEIKPTSMGLKDGFSLECIGELLEQLEGPLHR